MEIKVKAKYVLMAGVFVAGMAVFLLGFVTRVMVG